MYFRNSYTTISRDITFRINRPLRFSNFVSLSGRKCKCAGFHKERRHGIMEWDGYSMNIYATLLHVITKVVVHSFYDTTKLVTTKHRSGNKIS